MKTNRFEKHKKLTLVIFVLVMALALDFAAGAIFLTRPPEVVDRIPNAYYNHDLKPMWSNTESWGAGPYLLTTNHLGFKDRSMRTIPLDAGRRRILFIGDSFTEGIGIPFDRTFVGRIQNELDAQGVDVLNAGVASYAPKLYYFKTKYLLEHGLKFDELAVFIDLSDVQDEIAYLDWKPTTPDAFRFRWDKFTHKVDRFFEHHSLIYLHSLRPLLLGEGKRQLRAFLFGGGRVTPEEAKYIADRGSWTFDDTVYNEWGKEGVDLALKNMQQLYELCKEHGIKMSVAVYPWPITILHKDLNSRQVSIWQNFAKERSLDFYNFFPAFIATTTPVDQELATYYLPGDTHWTSPGHQVIADEWLSQYAKNNKKK